VAHDSFDDFSQTATGHAPYDYRRQLAEDETIRSQLVHAPTGKASGQRRFTRAVTSSVYEGFGEHYFCLTTNHQG
jgi:hypothetical protein